MSQPREGCGGARPSPLTIYKDSYLIRKAHSPPPPRGWSSFSSNSAASGGKVNIHHQHHQRQQQQRRRPPVIIYTQSPKVIHTEPHDFMALVQKLTGMSRSSDDNTGGSSPRRGCARSDCDGAVKAAPAGSVDDSSSSTTTSEKTGDEDEHGVLQLSATAAADGSPPAVPYDQYPSTNPFLPDVPIFTPTALYYCYPNDHFYYRPWSDNVGDGDYQDIYRP